VAPSPGPGSVSVTLLDGLAQVHGQVQGLLVGVHKRIAPVVGLQGRTPYRSIPSRRRSSMSASTRAHTSPVDGWGAGWCSLRARIWSRSVIGCAPGASPLATSRGAGRGLRGRGCRGCGGGSRHLLRSQHGSGILWWLQARQRHQEVPEGLAGVLVRRGLPFAHEGVDGVLARSRSRGGSRGLGWSWLHLSRLVRFCWRSRSRWPRSRRSLPFLQARLSRGS
jgi:hypothetical protein